MLSAMPSTVPVSTGTTPSSRGPNHRVRRSRSGKIGDRHGEIPATVLALAAHCFLVIGAGGAVMRLDEDIKRDVEEELRGIRT
jgi:hypothetical protein